MDEKILDAYFDQNDIQGAKSYLEDCLRVAVERDEPETVIICLNELLGIARETENVSEGMYYAGIVEKLMDESGLQGTLPYATMLINTANAYRAFHEMERSEMNFRRAEEILVKMPDIDPFKLAELHNNLSLLMQEQGDYEGAAIELRKALEIVQKTPGKRFEEAVTYANLAATYGALLRDNEAENCALKSAEIFKERNVYDAHHAAALNVLGDIHVSRGEREKAMDYYVMAANMILSSIGDTTPYRQIREKLDAIGYKAPSGMELARGYYEEYGKRMLEEQFPEYVGRIAAGYAGEGSDCFGFDDEYSRDHDFGPGFCIWMSREDYDRIGEKLTACYESLPKYYKGYRRNATACGRHRTGVMTVEGWLQQMTGLDHLPSDESEWLYVKREALAQVVNGEIYRDDSDVIMHVRRQAAEYLPADIYYRNLAQEMTEFAQSGLYNYPRMLRRGDSVSAGLKKARAVKAALKLCYLARRTYEPHEKWLMKGLQRMAEQGDRILQNVLDAVKAIYRYCEDGEHLFDDLALQLKFLLTAEGIIDGDSVYLADYAEDMMQLALLSALSEEEVLERIVQAEYAAFDQVINEGGRADCQDNPETFAIMRKSQYMTWPSRMRVIYLKEFEDARKTGRNPIMEKYGYMMETTTPEKYREIAYGLPKVSEEKKAIIHQVCTVQVAWMEEFAREHPNLASQARIIHTADDTPYDTSYETYLRGELSTYSDRMLMLYARLIVELFGQNRNLAYMTMENTIRLYGYRSFEEAEELLS